MYVLALETSSTRGSVALLDSTELVEEVLFSEGLVHGREANLQIDRLLGRHGLGPAALGAVAVSAGPGSYTGIRVGVTVAKTLGCALDRPVVPISSLEVIAGNALRPEGSPAGLPPAPVVPPVDTLAVVLDGKQGQLYHAAFSAEGRCLRRVTDDIVVSLDVVSSDGLPGVPPGSWIVGDAARLVLSRSPSGRYQRGPGAWDRPSAGVLGILAVEKLGLGLALTERAQIHALEPVYMRVSEAERRFLAASGPREESGPRSTP